MRPSVEEIVELVKDIDSEDPIDWAMLAVDEDQATELIVNNIIDQYTGQWLKMTEHDRERIMLATICKLVLENFALHIQLRQ